MERDRSCARETVIAVILCAIICRVRNKRTDVPSGFVSAQTDKGQIFPLGVERILRGFARRNDRDRRVFAADRAGRARGVRFAARSLADLADTEMVAAAFLCRKGEFMSREPFEAMPDVMDAKQIAEALQISKAGHTTF